MKKRSVKTIRDRLIDLLKNIPERDCNLCNKDDEYCNEMCFAESIADHLLKNGVIVPLCKIGDVVFQIDVENVFCSTVRSILVDGGKVVYDTDAISFDSTAIEEKNIFLSRGDAEKVLKGLADEEKEREQK